MFVNQMPRFEVLSADALATLEGGWERLATEVGVKFDSPRALDLFRAAGQTVEGDLVRFDPGFLRADDFEGWLRTVVSPAVAKKPELARRWEVLRSTEAADGVVSFLFLFQGGSLEEWDLEPMLEEALGVDGASRAMSQFADMLVDQQQSWALTRVNLAD